MISASTSSNEEILGATALQPARANTSGRLWAGRVLSALTVCFLLMDGGMKLFKPPFVVQATLQLGYPESTIVGIGIVLLASTLLYLLRRTSVLGAILLTGYLGGAVASKVRVRAGWLEIVFPALFAVLAWGGLWLRDSRLRALLLNGEVPSTGGN